MNLNILPIGLYQENIYILHEDRHVLIVDPGRYHERILACVEKEEKVDGIVLTHGHEDHTGAVDDLVDRCHCQVWMHPADRPLIDPREGKHGYASPVYSPVEDLQKDMVIGHFHIHVYHTPGHTAGSVCIRYRNLLFTGDTLFASDIGRTDLYSGDEEEMYRSLHFLKTLPNDLQVFPGHGPASMMKEEKERNPWLVQISAS